MLLTQPHHLLSPSRLLPRLLAVARSSAFLSTFVSAIWLAVCGTRTLLLARLFPGVSHDIWDGPYGCVLAGCLACGGSIWVESARRRGEIALYVLPRAVRASIPERWLRSGHRATRIMERSVCDGLRSCMNIWANDFSIRLAFALSLASLLTTAVHRPDTLRGMSRGMLAFVMNGSMRKPKASTAAIPVSTDVAHRSLREETASAQ